ncbi:MAG: hypothetical protein KJP10_02495 [Gammaproteobacteria bacterium]|nr:hypothetical protein [Gammaproteobacteria bacterium]
MPIALRILAIILLKAGPQHLPYSLPLLAAMISLYLASGVLVLTISMEFGQALASMLLDAGVLFTFSYFCLSLLNYRSRMVQMVTALAGVGIVYHLLALPLFIQFDAMQGQQQGVRIAALLMLLLISWQVLVFAHVFRQTMQMSMGRSLALSFGYLFLSMAAAEILFPGS